MLTVDPHPLLELQALVTELPHGIDGLDLHLEALIGPETPLDLEVKTAVRDLFRVGGFKPLGRNKLASEYLKAARLKGRLGSINPLVDALNAASYRFGLPISVVDLDRTEGPLRTGIVDTGRYVFNASGQELNLAGLLCLHDAQGPCANAIKDSHRTKTLPTTRRTLTLIWSTTALPGRGEACAEWYQNVLVQAGAPTTRV